MNYQAGLVWSRDPQLRLVYHANNNVHVALSFENPEQYIGGSSGGSAVTLPSALATPYGTQLDNGGTTLSAPNKMPDIVAKLAFDGAKKFHFELGGVIREFHVWNPAASAHYSATGSAVQANLNFELASGLRILTNNYWSDGGGRYIFGHGAGSRGSRRWEPLAGALRIHRVRFRVYSQELVFVRLLWRQQRH